REPSDELARRHAAAAGLAGEALEPGELLDPIRAWLGSPLRAERIARAVRVRAEVPILLGVGGTVLRGSIDLLVERDAAPPLVVDYKTDRLDGSTPEEHAARYATQRTIYALAAAEALGADEVEVAYVFLERPAEPVLTVLGPAERGAGRAELERAIARIHSGDFPVAPQERRDWSLCNGCPALGNLCRGPDAA
ncbi:MAG TPA: PD-(D/E)XK nuclease family protein, partial [Solirubrobacterales bacterium]